MTKTNISISISKKLLEDIETNIKGKERSEKIVKCCLSGYAKLKGEICQYIYNGQCTLTHKTLNELPLQFLLNHGCLEKSQRNCLYFLNRKLLDSTCKVLERLSTQFGKERVRINHPKEMTQKGTCSYLADRICFKTNAPKAPYQCLHCITVYVVRISERIRHITKIVEKLENEKCLKNLNR